MLIITASSKEAPKRAATGATWSACCYYMICVYIYIYMYREREREKERERERDVYQYYTDVSIICIAILY